MHEALLGTDSNKKPITSSSGNESESETDEELLGKYRGNESAPAFKKKLFCLKFGSPTYRSLSIDGLLSELIQIKKVSGRDAYVQNYGSIRKNYDHRMEVTRGNIAPTAKALAKSCTSRVSDRIKVHQMNLKRESSRSNKAFKEVAECVNDISSRKRNGEYTKLNLDQESQLSSSSVRIIKREKIIKIVKSEEINFARKNSFIIKGE